MNNPIYLIVHHTGGSDANPLQDSSNFTFEQCNEQHRIAFNMKSSFGYYIGYHYYISKDGTVRQGRLDTDEGAHTIGYNLKSLGICLAGNFDATSPTQAQITALQKLLWEKCQQYNLNPVQVVPHRKFAVKTCYGNKLGDTWAADLVRTFVPLPPTPPTTPPVLSNKEKSVKAQALIAQAVEILKTIN